MGLEGLRSDLAILARPAAIFLACIVGVVACSAEKRSIGPQAPLTPPSGPDDPRASVIETNAFQISEGGRLFRWHGCDQCHTETSQGAANLTRFDRRYGDSTTQLYASIAQGRPDGMPAYAGKIASQQIWQLAAYVGNLPSLPAPKRQRSASEQLGEGQGDRWAGALR
jgi:cytochrome c oxidase cbb3-type subunit 3